ncbi:beta-glucosidase [Duganella sp. BJB488]|uniref:glycoside hydrolase family 3 N-terminal domain-containing protein n=1 Tax=unclassified Duganella TaxID=2636909 RepID=UPI000E34E053|nr:MULTISPECIES: glycoside hydrolase family 3 N-terminal domain-containing protein [unclassified Duganella]RFP15418.1 beta-glucosidase [Duganella sp. BJB489]RFP19975.1 beta-glucosidase [Duganella sp. BJB488]RFP38363.1 beta-glucosidase [Duganella sp. BJB480]
MSNDKRRQFLKSMTGLAGAASLAPAMALGATARPPYKDASLPLARRVDDLLGRMTLDEKVAQMQCIWQDKKLIQDAQNEFSAEKAARMYPHGLGMVARPSDRQVGQAAGAGDTGVVANRNAFETATYVNAMQKWALEQTRLGIPLLMHEESLHGYVARDATSFPQAIGLASSFDTDMVRDIFSAAAREMRARGANLALAPVVDVAREPRWGRIEETYGEDPHLCGEMGKAAVLGFMGESRQLAKDKVYATLKHMTGHGQPESGTNIGPAEVSERTLREEFFPPFEKLVRETHISAVMPSYNEIGGVPSHANRWLLTKVLREEWGFKGVTVSDYFGINELITRHKLAATPKEAALAAFKAGVDIETPDGQAYKTLGELVREKKIAEKDIDAVVRRILELKFLAGLFEQPYVDAKAADSLTATPEAVALARRAATRTPVLLKNDKGLLPLDAKKVGKVLLLGTHAKDCPIGGYSDVPRHVVSIHDGLLAESRAQGFELRYAEGVRITEGHVWGADEIKFTAPEVNARLIAEAVEAAKSADTIIMVLGDNEQTSREAWADNHLGDRDSLDLMGQQNDLARAIFALGKPTVVFLLNGRPLSVNLLAEKAGALIEGWYMGQETGHAAADLLFGRANPGGKLPVSIARSVGQLPVFYNHKPSARRGYIDGLTTPLYPFGFGLSYTSFDISAPRLAKASIRAGESTRVEVDVRNTGKLAGDEVVQIYIRDDVSSVTRPVLELKAFKRVTLQPGEQRTLSFDITPADLWFYNIDMKRVVEPGSFTIHAGPDSVQLKSIKLMVS